MTGFLMQLRKSKGSRGAEALHLNQGLCSQLLSDMQIDRLSGPGLNLLPRRLLALLHGCQTALMFADKEGRMLKSPEKPDKGEEL